MVIYVLGLVRMLVLILKCYQWIFTKGWVLFHQHAHFVHVRSVSDNDVISTQDSVDLIIWRRFPSDQQPGPIQQNGDISRKHWRHWRGQKTENKEEEMQKELQSRQEKTSIPAPASKHSGSHPTKQSPMVREGRKFRGAPPLKCFFRVSYVTFQGKKMWRSSKYNIFVTRTVSGTHSCLFCTFLFLHTAIWSGKRLAQYERLKKTKQFE